MSFTTVYRVEDDQKRGPYCGSNETQFTPGQRMKYNMMLTIVSKDWNAHPTPNEDKGLRGINPNEYCAFESIDHVREWFKGAGRILTECGFIVNAYRVPQSSVRFGETQCLVTNLPAHTPTHTFPASTVIS